jgi:hypothetical protein
VRVSGARRRAFGGLWARWTVIARWLGDRQAALVYLLLYALVVGPTALLRRLGRDPLGRRRRGPAESYWAPRRALSGTLEDARRP